MLKSSTQLTPLDKLTLPRVSHGRWVFGTDPGKSRIFTRRTVGGYTRHPSGARPREPGEVTTSVGALIAEAFDHVDPSAYRGFRLIASFGRRLPVALASSRWSLSNNDGPILIGLV